MLQRLTRLRALLCLGLLGAGVTSRAATITWETPANMASANDIYLGGTEKYGYTWGTTGTNSNGESFFTGITTTNGNTNFLATGFTVRNGTTYTSFSAPYANLPVSYKNVLQGGDFSAGTNCSLTLSNLTPGTSYALQVLIQDPRGPATAGAGTNRNAVVANTIADGGAGVTLRYNTTAVDGGMGQCVVGKFIADGSTVQSFTITGGVIPSGTGTPNSQINCFQLRDLTPVPAATPTFSLDTNGVTYFGAQNIIVSSEIGSTIYYTTNDTAVNTNTALSGVAGSGFASVNIPAGATTTIRAVAAADDKFKTLSAESGATYTTSLSEVATWDIAGGGSWTNTANWLSGIAAFGPNATADFSTKSLGAPAIVTVDINRTNGSMFFDDQSGSNNLWMITNAPSQANTLTLSVTTGSPVISNNVPVIIAISSLLGSQGFTKAGTGTLVVPAGPISGNVYIENGGLQLGISTALSSATVNLGTANSGSATTTLRLAPSTNSTTALGSVPIVVSSADPSSTAIVEGNPISTNVNGIFNGTITLQGGRSVMFTNSGAPPYGLNRNISGTGDVIASTTSYANRIRLNPSSPSTNNSWVGNLIITNGGLQISDGTGTALVNKSAIPDTADVIMAANTVLGFGANETFGALNGDATAVVGEDYITNNTALNMTLGANNNSGVFNGTIWLRAVGTNPNANMPLQITKIGTGTQIFNGSCSNTAPTRVGGGVLIINSPYFASPVTVSNAATLGGSGTIVSNVTFSSGASATNNQGSPLSISGSLTLNNNTMNVSTPSALGAGNYTLMTYNTTGSSGSFNSTPNISGSGLAADCIASITTSGGFVRLVVVGTNANLSNLTLSSGTLAPVFASGIFGYSAGVANGTASITVTPTSADANATIRVQVNGGGYSIVASGSPSGSLALNVGANTVDVQVTAQDNATIQTYTTTVTRAPSANADLASLVVSPAGALSPAFDAGTLAYAATEAYANSPITVTPTTADANATIQVQINGGGYASVTSGSPSGALALDPSPAVTNVVQVLVTAQDAVTTKTYEVDVVRQPSLTSPQMTSSVSGSTLTLSWPLDHLGWHLETQTNGLTGGITSGGWVAVPGTDLVTQTNVTIITTNPAVFFRMKYPN